jgi:hypothetical protein
MALSLKSRLEKSLGAEVRVTAVFNYPTIDGLSEYLLGELLPTSVQEAVLVPAGADDAVSRIKAMSEEDVDRLLRLKTNTRDVG